MRVLSATIGCDEASRILEEGLQQYPGSAIFLYFRGKVHYLRVSLSAS